MDMAVTAATATATDMVVDGTDTAAVVAPSVGRPATPVATLVVTEVVAVK